MSEFDPVQIEVWTRNRNISREACCKQCVQAKMSIHCVACKKEKLRSDFDPVRLEVWTRNRNISREACCNQCVQARESIHCVDCKSIHCVDCKQQKPGSDFDPVRMEIWTRNRNISRQARCKQCVQAAKSIQCVECKQEKPDSDFDPVRMEIWTRNRDVSRKACCNQCVQKKSKRIRVQQDRRLSAKSSPHCHRYQHRHHQQQRHQHHSQKSTEKPSIAISIAIINSNDISIIPINQHKTTGCFRTGELPLQCVQWREASKAIRLQGVERVGGEGQGVLDPMHRLQREGRTMRQRRGTMQPLQDVEEEARLQCIQTAQRYLWVVAV